MARALRYTLFFMLWAAGCHAGDPGDVTLARVPDEYLAAVCASAVRCRYHLDVATCRASSVAPDWLITGLAAVKAGLATYRGHRMAACIERLSGGECTVTSVLATGLVCREVFEGALLADEPCDGNVECGSGSCSSIVCAGACCTGTCDLPEPHNVPLGGRCTTDAECADGLCGPDRACVPWPTEGEACASGTLCGPSLFCDVAMGICRGLPARGGACRGIISLCDNIADGCDATTGTCVPRIDVGQPCVDGTSGMLQNCLGYAWCDGAVCQPRPFLGESCVSAACLGNLQCDAVSSTCVLPPPTPMCTR